MKAYRELPDGTRVYLRSGVKYKPVPLEQRKYQVRRPDDPRAFRINGKWFLPREWLDEKLRRMPLTRPDSDAYDHMDRTANCRCDVCLRPEAERWRRKWRRDRGLQA